MSLTNRKKFKIGLYCEDKLICERLFDAECYNHITRNNVDVRDDFFYYMGELKSLLNTNRIKNNFYGYKYDERSSNKIRTSTFKLVLTNNENIVIEREFTTSHSEKNLYSPNIVDYIKFIVDDISAKIREQDINMMWEDYDLIRIYNLDIQGVRGLSNYVRESRLKKIYSEE